MPDKRIEKILLAITEQLNVIGKVLCHIGSRSSPSYDGDYFKAQEDNLKDIVNNIEPGAGEEA